MDYIKEMNAFYDLDLANQLTPNAISLYFALLNIANKLYWKADFVVSNLTLQSRSGIADRKTLDRARNQLIQKGLIEYKPSGKVNQAGSYTIIGCVGQLVGKNATQNATQDGTQDGTQNATQNGTQDDPINKQNKTKQNKKENIPPISPPKKKPDKKLFSEFVELTENVEADKVTVASDEQPGEKSGPRSPFKSKRQEQLFDEFWAQYPKKRNKGQAERAWAKIKPDEQLFKAILDGLERAKKSRDWLKNEGQFIPYPATWLNAKGWEDVHNDLMRREEEATFDWGYGYKPD